MRVYSYIVRYDIGFAPNPFHDVCTLATCKPQLRGGASPGDWVVGTGSKQRGLDGHLVYAMRVDEKLTFDQYWNDVRFATKHPDLRGSLKYRYGDNIYHRDPDGNWLQADSRHSLDDGAPNADHIKRDTTCDAVLVGSTFTYWGGRGPEIPAQLRDWGGVDLCSTGAGFKYSVFDEQMSEAVITWLLSLPSGLRADPADWG